MSSLIFIKVIAMGMANKKRGNPPEYLAWRDMKRRCLDPRDKNYEDYGGRAISICGEWINSYAAFLVHVGPKPEPKRAYSLGRIKNEGNYEPGNVAWQTKKEQMANTRRNRFLVLNGETFTLTQLAERFNKTKCSIRYRLNCGMSIEDAVTRKNVSVGGDRTGCASTPKLTEENVRNIRKEFKLNGNKKEMGKKYGVAPAVIRTIVNRQSWKWVMD